MDLWEDFHASWQNLKQQAANREELSLPPAQTLCHQDKMVPGLWWLETGTPSAAVRVGEVSGFLQTQLMARSGKGRGMRCAETLVNARLTANLMN